MSSMIQRLRAQGFDRSEVVPFARQWRVRCSQCQAMTINGVAVHERNCPHEVHECKGCSAIVGRYERWCEDCR